MQGSFCTQNEQQKRVGARFITFLAPKKHCTLNKNIVFLELSRNSSAELENHLRFVKNIPKKNGNFDLALRKRLFCAAKQPLLPCKTYAFATQNNRFYKTLIHSWLCKIFTYKNSLHIFSLLLP
ncbi:hypothetical protein CUB95_10285 [Prevotella intermedia]|nr:hypothetical protein CUB95_10285 [Prevotella intermedia]